MRKILPVERRKMAPQKRNPFSIFLSFNSIHYLVILFAIGISESHGQGQSGPGHHSGHSHHMPKKNVPENILRNNDFIRDYEHIKEDLKAQYHQDFKEDLDEVTMENYYFQLHDLDKDGMLDGLEILAAINHIMERDKEQLGVPEDKDAHILLQRWWNVQFEEDAEHVDEVLKAEDLNNDGYISYLEYAIGREKERGIH